MGEHYEVSPAWQRVVWLNGQHMKPMLGFEALTSSLGWAYNYHKPQVVWQCGCSVRLDAAKVRRVRGHTTHTHPHTPPSTVTTHIQMGTYLTFYVDKWRSVEQCCLVLDGLEAVHKTAPDTAHNTRLWVTRLNTEQVHLPDQHGAEAVTPPSTTPQGGQLTARNSAILKQQGGSRRRAGGGITTRSRKKKLRPGSSRRAQEGTDKTATAACDGQAQDHRCGPLKSTSEPGQTLAQEGLQTLESQRCEGLNEHNSERDQLPATHVPSDPKSCRVTTERRQIIIATEERLSQQVSQKRTNPSDTESRLQPVGNHFITSNPGHQASPHSLSNGTEELNKDRLNGGVATKDLLDCSGASSDGVNNIEAKKVLHLPHPHPQFGLVFQASTQVDLSCPDEVTAILSGSSDEDDEWEDDADDILKVVRRSVSADITELLLGPSPRHSHHSNNGGRHNNANSNSSISTGNTSSNSTSNSNTNSNSTSNSNTNSNSTSNSNTNSNSTSNSNTNSTSNTINSNSNSNTNSTSNDRIISNSNDNTNSTSAGSINITNNGNTKNFSNGSTAGANNDGINSTSDGNTELANNGNTTTNNKSNTTNTNNDISSIIDGNKDNFTSSNTSSHLTTTDDGMNGTPEATAASNGNGDDSFTAAAAGHDGNYSFNAVSEAEIRRNEQNLIEKATEEAEQDKLDERVNCIQRIQDFEKKILLSKTGRTHRSQECISLDTNRNNLSKISSSKYGRIKSRSELDNSVAVSTTNDGCGGSTQPPSMSDNAAARMAVVKTMSVPAAMSLTRSANHVSDHPCKDTSKVTIKESNQDSPSPNNSIDGSLITRLNTGTAIPTAATAVQPAVTTAAPAKGALPLCPSPAAEGGTQDPCVEGGGQLVVLLLQPSAPQQAWQFQSAHLMVKYSQRRGDQGEGQRRLPRRNLHSHTRPRPVARATDCTSSTGHCSLQSNVDGGDLVK